MKIKASDTQTCLLLHTQIAVDSSIIKTVARNIATLSMITAIYINSTTAQNLSYRANNFYRSNNVTIQPISFSNQSGMIVAGNLFSPKNLDSSVNASAIIIRHPMGAVREQSANLYTTKLAEQGFVTISVNTPFYGYSDGEPRNSVYPELYAEAFSAAADYLGLQNFVDREWIGALSICSSGSFVISAAKIDARIKAIATASMYDIGSVNRKGLQRAQSLEQRKEIIVTAALDGGRWRRHCIQSWHSTRGHERVNCY